ncbi:alpha/beta fold hydrolase [Flammeovirga pectinis]|uniref:Alpha/beta fold hydrolase n=1 Tax=Flammeovirga pectinis TaxID=2494373 RepID=A0A3Q9FMQ3_9BACT|nr:alpha/beta fold hydrolase [Flammeovirga pectinis]AZQ63322.1 alpha/beta fold hydrolase [Flammeovirga pectinis]
MNLFYREIGEKGNTPFLIFHGLFGQCDNWMTLGKVLSEKFHVYMIDQRNHGQSPHSEDFSYQFLADDIKDFIEQHEIEKPIVLGHSMGGKAVMQFAANYPSMLSRMIIVDIAPRFYPVHHQVILEGLNALPITTIKTRGEADKALAEYIPNFGERSFLLKNIYRKKEGGFAWRPNLKVITENIEEVGKALESNHLIEVPTLFIGGSSSNYIQEADQKEINEKFASVHIVMIDGAGHWVHAEKPKELLEAINKFVF